jgi:CBS domain-containing protein
VPGNARATTTVAQVAAPFDRVVTTRPDDELVDLIGRFTVGSGRRALVMEGAALIGIVTASDIERTLEVAGVEGAALHTPAHMPH